MYRIDEEDGTDPNIAHMLRYFNARDDQFPPLTDSHLRHGYWWLIRADTGPVGFAGMVPFVPFPRIGYMKRCFITPSARGNNLQIRALYARELKARQLGWTMLVSECSGDNVQSIGNMLKAGFEPTIPEQPWGKPGALYFQKAIS